jgi:hypothetical protein
MTNWPFASSSLTTPPKPPSRGEDRGDMRKLTSLISFAWRPQQREGISAPPSWDCDAAIASLER